MLLWWLGWAIALADEVADRVEEACIDPAASVCVEAARAELDERLAHGDVESVRRAHQQLAWVLRAGDRLTEAMEVLEGLLERLPERQVAGRLETRQNLAVVALEAGALERARKVAEQALAEVGGAPVAERLEALQLVRMVAVELRDEGRWWEARALLGSARESVEQLPLSPATIALRHDLAVLDAEAGDAAAARAQLTVLLEQLPQDTDPRVRAFVTLTLTDQLVVLGELERARSLADGLLALPLDGGLRFRALNSLGLVRYELSDLRGAERTLLEGLDVAVEAGVAPAEQATLRRNLAMVAEGLHGPEVALSYLDPALAALREAYGDEHPAVLSTEAHRIELLSSTQGPSRAILALQSLLSSVERSAGPEAPEVELVLELLWPLQARAGRLIDATITAERLLVQRQARLPAAHPLVALSLENLAQLSLHIGDPDRAAELASQALEARHWSTGVLLDGVSQQEQLSLVAEAQSALGTWLSTSPPPERAYAEVLRSKGRSRRLLSLRAEQALSATDAELAPLLGALTRTRHRLAQEVHRWDGADEQLIVTLEEERDRLEREVAARSDTLEAEARLQGTDWRQVCQALAPDEVLIDVHRWPGVEASRLEPEDRYTAFVLEGGACTEVQSVELGEAAPLDEAVERYVALLADPVGLTARSMPVGDEVVERLWTPLAPLVGERRLWWVPPGSLSRLPLAALPWRDGFLVEHTAVRVLDAAGDLVRSRARAATGALVVGGVDYGEAVACGYLPLPGTAREAAVVAARLPDAELLTGDKATEAAVVAASTRAGRVHLATHGQTTARGCDGATKVAGMLGAGVALAGANLASHAEGGNDGFWSAEEVCSLDLRHTELVVLSACESGRGTEVAGEGVLGLRRAFALAGARQLVLTLWPVSDTPTAQLMARFYRHARRAGWEPAGALREAQLAQLAENRRVRGDSWPHSWAGVALIGAPGRQE